MSRQPVYEPVDKKKLSPAEVEEGLDLWATRAEGSRRIEAVVYALKVSRIAHLWPDFPDYLDIVRYKDPDDPQMEPYLVARVIDWDRLHNGMPEISEIGKPSFGLVVYARMLGDRGFQCVLNDLVEGMDEATKRLADNAHGIFCGRRIEPWNRKEEY
jgi:hypothetical protein